MNFFSLSLKDTSNFFYLVLNGGFFYILYNLLYLKLSFINFLVSSPIFLFFDLKQIYIYNFNLNLSYFFKYNNFISLKVFNDYLISNCYLNYNYFESEYLISKKFKKIILINSNLPIFFYFLILFILTTIFSLLLLSYLGLYGVFFYKFYIYRTFLVMFYFLF